MFGQVANPVQTDSNPSPSPASSGGLGMDIRDFMRTASPSRPWGNCNNLYGWRLEQTQEPPFDS
jgi:hypothetical protein